MAARGPAAATMGPRDTGCGIKIAVWGKAGLYLPDDCNYTAF